VKDRWTLAVKTRGSLRAIVQTEMSGSRRKAFALGPSLAVALIVLVALTAAPTSLTGASNGPMVVKATGAVSANWAGYVATRSPAKTADFTRVFAAWVQPAATCVPGEVTDSAFWVGLGGFNAGSRALEQTGTDAACSASGQATYSVWYELVPAAPVTVKIPVAPGDSIVASVAVSGRKVTVRIGNYTRKETFTKKLSSHFEPDVSSAEWIAEAPSDCMRAGYCLPLPLADFGTVEFVSAKATAAGHTGPISDPTWSATPIALDPLVGPSPMDVTVPRATAIPSALSNDVNGSSFKVSWSATTGSPGEPPGP
jgi:Peptidase A4 family